MNYNIISYISFLSLMAFIILKVGWICYENGNIFVFELIKTNPELCKKLNQILLIGYYLLNLGYSAMTLISWQKILSFNQALEVIGTKIGLIVLILSALHYSNIYIISKYHKSIFNF